MNRIAIGVVLKQDANYSRPHGPRVTPRKMVILIRMTLTKACGVHGRGPRPGPVQLLGLRSEHV